MSATFLSSLFFVKFSISFQFLQRVPCTCFDQFQTLSFSELTFAYMLKKGIAEHSSFPRCTEVLGLNVSQNKMTSFCWTDCFVYNDQIPRRPSVFQLLFEPPKNTRPQCSNSWNWIIFHQFCLNSWNVFDLLTFHI